MILIKNQLILLAIFGAICVIVESRGIDQATTCGQVIDLENEGFQGTISYKPIVSYAANERCTWTLRGPDLSSATFVMVQSGINGADPYERVSINGFSRTLDNPAPLFLRSQGDTGTIRNIDVLIVTFASGSAPVGTGFVLNYDTVRSSSSPTSRMSVDFVSNSTLDRETVDHPGGGHKYDHAEISTFLIVPLGFNLGGNPTLRSEWRMKSLETNCRDRVTLHKFYTDAGWSVIDTYCQTPVIKFASHRDMLLFVFRTDTSVDGDGFNLLWSIESGE